MADPIPESVRKIWDKWNVRGVILLSLSLQATLFLLAPLRKGTKNKLIILFIWSVYLLSDWAAIFALGLISNSQRDSPDISRSGEHGDLLAFWTPFLILHLGGPDNITAFALEDNELWFRHLVGLLIQAVAVLYIFLLSLSNTKLAIPTVVMFIAASIKYLERTRAFYLASFDGFQDSTFKESPYDVEDDYNAEDVYNNFMDEHKSKLKAELPAKRDTIEEPDNGSSLNELEVMHYAYYYFRTFKGIVIDLILEVYQHQMSRDFFGILRPKDALRVIEAELNLIYEVFYTKVQVVYSLAGFISRFVFLGLVVAALSIFHFKVKKHGFDEFDVAITYALFLVAIKLDVMAVFTLVAYDLTFGTLTNPNNVSQFFSQMKFRIVVMLSWVLTLKKPRWYACNNHSDKPTHEVLATPFLFGRWSGYVSGYNLLRYCLKGRPSAPHKVKNCLQRCIEKVIHSLGVDQVIWILGIAINKVRAFLNKNCLSWFFGSFIELFGFMIGKIFGFLGLGTFVDEIRYVSHDLLTNEFWEFLFNEFKARSYAAHDSEEAVKISSARGAWIMKDKYYKGRLMSYLTEVTFDESVLLWHIATELLYQTDEQSINNYREFSKALSDYMLYLLIMNSTVMSTVVGTAKIRFQDTCDATIKFFQTCSKPNPYQILLYGRTSAVPETQQAVKSKSVLVDAIILAKQLQMLDEVSDVAEVEMEDKWESIRRMWGEGDQMEDKRQLIRESRAGEEKEDKGESIRQMQGEEDQMEDKRQLIRESRAGEEKEDKGESIREIQGEEDQMEDKCHIIRVLSAGQENEAKGESIKQMWWKEDQMQDKRQLIRELWTGEEKEDKWELISKVWVELLSYAAYYSTPRTHIQQVSKGGELITFVWFLMAHFGLRQQFHTTKQQLGYRWTR